jgi:hypothetical protein
MSTEEETDAKNTDAGQGRDIGSGYPEEQPGGANPGPQKSDSGGGAEKPATSGDRDSDPAAATGNPDAAGGNG